MLPVAAVAGAMRAAAVPVGEIVASGPSGTGAATGLHVAPPSTLRRTVGSGPPHSAHSVVGAAATTVAPGQGAARFTKCSPRFDEAQSRPRLAGELSSMIQSDEPDSAMLTREGADVNGKATTFQLPVEVSKRWSVRWSQRW